MMEKVNNPYEDVLQGIALQYGNSDSVEYEFPCPVCGLEVEVDDFEAAYRCEECGNAIRFDIADIKQVGREKP